MSLETVARIIEALLEVLGDVGVPGASAARLAIRGVESLRKSQAARRRLEELLQQAEEDFLQEARREGWSLWPSGSPPYLSRTSPPSAKR
jgi:hypothetical protein